MSEQRFPFDFSPKEKAKPTAIREQPGGLTPQQKRMWLIVGGIVLAALFLLSRMSNSGGPSQSANAPGQGAHPRYNSPAVEIPDIRTPPEPVTHRPVLVPSPVGIPYPVVEPPPITDPMMETGTAPTLVKAPSWNAYYEGLMKFGSHQAVAVSLTFTQFANDGDSVTARIAVIGHSELSMTASGSLDAKDKHAMTLEPETWLMQSANKHAMLVGHYPDIRLSLNADGSVTGYRSGSDSFRFSPVDRSSGGRTDRPRSRRSTSGVTDSGTPGATLQGEFRLVRANGKTQPAETAPHRWVFDSDGQFRWLVGEAVFRKGTFRLSTPGSLQVTTETGTSLGLWKRRSNGDVEFCFSSPGKPRPQALQSNKRIGAVVYLATPASGGGD